MVVSLSVVFVDGDVTDLPASFEDQFSTTLAAEARVETGAVEVTGVFPGSILVTASVLFTGTRVPRSSLSPHYGGVYSWFKNLARLGIQHPPASLLTCGVDGSGCAPPAHETSVYDDAAAFVRTMQCCTGDVFRVNPFFDYYGAASLRSLSSVGGPPSEGVKAPVKLVAQETPAAGREPIYEQVSGGDVQR